MIPLMMKIQGQTLKAKTMPPHSFLLFLPLTSENFTPFYHRLQLLQARTVFY